jgi:tRNA(fMet)-specific endonuclease VapC
MNSPTGVLLDTNVLSYLFRQAPLAAFYETQRAGRVAYLACATPEELYFGAMKRNWGESRRRALDELIAEYVLLPTGLHIAKISARLRAERERVGRSLDKADAWIAATAVAYSLTLFTHDQDFRGIDGLRIVIASSSRVGGTDERGATGSDTPVSAASFDGSAWRLH